MRYMAIAVIVSLFGLNSCSSTNGISGQNSVTNAPKEAVTTDNFRQTLNYVNSIRAKGATCGPSVAPINWNNNLANAASAHVNDMAINGFVKHAGSGGSYDIAGSKEGIQSSFIDRIKYFGFPFVTGNLVGENIARVSIKNTKTNQLMPNFKRAVENWLNDPPHCEILMNKRFTDIGMAYYKKGEYYYFVMDLGEKK